MAKDCQLSVRMFAEEMGLDKKCSSWNSNRPFAHAKNLSVEQKVNRLEICQDLLGRLEIEPDFMDKVITGDESWVFNYDPKIKQQSAGWHTKISCLKKAHMSRSRLKTMIIVFFFNSCGILHEEFVPSGQIVNHAFYKDVLERF